MSETCRETNGEKSKSNQSGSRECCLSTGASLLAQVTEATAAGLQASHPGAAQQPRGQVLGNGSYHGNAEKTKHVSARRTDTGEPTVTAPHS